MFIIHTFRKKVLKFCRFITNQLNWLTNKVMLMSVSYVLFLFGLRILPNNIRSFARDCLLAEGLEFQLKLQINI